MQNILLVQGDTPVGVPVSEVFAESSARYFHVERVPACARALDRLAILGKQLTDAPQGIAAVLVDLSLPDAVGIEVYHRLHDAVPHIPIVILCSCRDEAVAIMAVRQGAEDYLLLERLDDHLLQKTLTDTIHRAAARQALVESKERAEVTLSSIGDGVIATDLLGRVTSINSVAERLTGWSSTEALGQPFEQVFHIVDETTRETPPNPMAQAMRQNETVFLTTHCMLVRRGGHEAAIEDSAAPIHDRHGKIIGAVMVFHDVSAARILTQRLMRAAQYDSLTDLPNRELWKDRLRQAITQAHRDRSAVAVLYLDLDRFKLVNDSLGHLIGDRLLQAVALRLCDCVRASDTVCRLGGDEFVILLSKIAHAEDAALCADKILQTLNSPFVIGEHRICVTASIGIGLYPEDGDDGESLLRSADFAMYDAKDSGRNSYQFCRAGLDPRFVAIPLMDAGLHNVQHRG